jgi:hypothetical protein
LAAYPVLAAAGARIAGGAVGAAVGQGARVAINSLIKTEYWL